MEAVAREAGVSKALVHYYFATRRELLRAAFRHAQDRARAHVDAELVEVPTAAERLERFLLLELDDASVFAESRALWSEAWSSMLLDEELRPDVEEIYGRWVDQLTGLVEAAYADAALTAEHPGDVALRLAALVDGLESLLLLGFVSRDQACSLVLDGIPAAARSPAQTRELGTTSMRAG